MTGVIARLLAFALLLATEYSRRIDRSIVLESIVGCYEVKNALNCSRKWKRLPNRYKPPPQPDKKQRQITPRTADNQSYPSSVAMGTISDK